MCRDNFFVDKICVFTVKKHQGVWRCLKGQIHDPGLGPTVPLPGRSSQAKGAHGLPLVEWGWHGPAHCGGSNPPLLWCGGREGGGAQPTETPPQKGGARGPTPQAGPYHPSPALGRKLPPPALLRGFLGVSDATTVTWMSVGHVRMCQRADKSLGS